MQGAEMDALVLSVKVAAACVAVVAGPGVLLGWLLARVPFPGRTWVQAAVQLPLVMPPVLVGYLLLITLGTRGWVGSYLHDVLGLRIAFTWWAAVLASAMVGLPLVVRSVRLAIEGVDRKLEQAARVCGARPLDVWCTVTLPAAWPGVLVGLMLAFVRSLGEFGATIMFAGNIEGQTRTLPLALYRAMQTPGGESAVTRIALIAVGLSVAAVLVSELLNRRTLAAREMATC
jgi:molybdate transport system permease protein